MVGWRSNAAADALELIPAWPVALINQAAARALAARVPGVYQIDRDATHPRLVFDQGTKFVDAPVVQSSPLTPVGLDPITDAFEVFDGNRRPAAFGVENDCFAQHVVGVALEACLLTASAPERTLSGAGADLLQGAAAGVLAAADIINLCTAVSAPKIVHHDVDDAEVNAPDIDRDIGGRLVRVARRGQHPFAANEHQINLALGVGEHVTLAVAADERDPLPAGERPDRNGILSGQKTEDAFVVGLGGVAMEGARLVLVADLECVGDLADAPNRHLRGQTEAGAHVGVGHVVQIVLPRLPGARADLASHVHAALQRSSCLAKHCRLFGIWKQPDRGDELHGSGALLCFDVAADDAFGHGSY